MSMKSDKVNQECFIPDICLAAEADGAAYRWIAGHSVIAMPPPWSVESSDRSRSPSLTVPRPRLWRIAGDGCEGRSLACRSRALPGSGTVPVVVPVIALATSRVAVWRAPAWVRHASVSILPELSHDD